MKVNKKGALGLGAMIVGGVLVLAGCASGGGDAKPSAPAEAGSITVWVDADRATVLKDAAKAFQDETGVEVKLVQKDFGVTWIALWRCSCSIIWRCPDHFCGRSWCEKR